jgi:hypothetical protein
MQPTVATSVDSSQQPLPLQPLPLQPLPPNPWYMDEAIFSTDTTVCHQPILPVVTSQQEDAATPSSTTTSALIDLSFDNAWVRDHDDWLHRALDTSPEATASSSRDARHARRIPHDRDRSRSPHDRDRRRRAVQVPLYTGPLYFLSGMSVGEACREALETAWPSSICSPAPCLSKKWSLRAGAELFERFDEAYAFILV